LPMLIAVFTAMVLGAGDVVNSSAAPGRGRAAPCSLSW
jgi:hypothetical protein